MKKRTLIFRAEGDDIRVPGQGWTTEDWRILNFDTASNGWTLTGWALSDPEQKTQFVEKAGGDGSWDLSTALTDGIPLYKDRTLTATLEISEGTRDDRVRQLSKLVNLLDGFVWEIVLPDHPDFFLKGRVRVAVNQNSLSYAMITLTATCEPWLYREQETEITVELKGHEVVQTVLWNDGRRVVSPYITATGRGALASYDLATMQRIDLNFTEGTFRWPQLVIPPGGQVVLAAGEGTLTFKFREAVLL